MRQGQTVTMHNPGDRGEHESWTRGVVRGSTLVGGLIAYIVEIDGFKWDAGAPWGVYDGVPEVLARPAGFGRLDSVEPELPRLEFIDTWPRRAAG